MNTSRIIAVVAILAVGAGGYWVYQRKAATPDVTYKFAAVERGTVESTVAATGTLNAVTTVQVGTQVSGQVAELHADFNDVVKKGQLLARIDPILQQQAVAEAEASLTRTQAQAEQTRAEFERNRQLLEAKIVTESEFTTIKANYAVAQSNVRSAQIALQRARQNLSYTYIYAPISGVIVSRAVELGQTVAASLQAPELFRIAQTLEEMQILASVDESDIGKIAEGQNVTFTVSAYGNKAFTGKVRQKRLLSATTDNVVNYTVVVAVENKDRALLPGMTATVKFVTGTAADVLTVPNAALRFRPAETMRVAATAGDSAARPPAGSPPQAAAGGAPRAPRTGAGGSQSGAVWTLDATGALVSHRVRVGLTDGRNTQITARDVTEGMQVVTAGTAPAAAKATASPFQQTQQQRGPGGPPPGGI